MTSEKLPSEDIEAERILVQQTQWLIERMEGVNQGLLTRATSLVGFAGVELTLIGQVVINVRKPAPSFPWTMLHSSLIFVPIVLGVGGLLISIYFLFKAIGLSGNPNIPSIQSLITRLSEIEQKGITSTEAHIHKIKFPLEQLLFPAEKDDSYNVALLKENKTRLDNYKSGFRSLAISQGLLGVIVLVIYWR